MFQKSVQGEMLVKNIGVVIWPHVLIFGTRTGSVQNVVKGTDAIIILL